MENRKKVCFVSDENVCRSIIAEVYLRNLARERFEVQSFGLSANRVHHTVAQALKDRNLSPDYSFSKVYEVIENQKFDVFVLMHSDLKDRLPKIKYDHKQVVWDISKLALNSNDEDQVQKDVSHLCEQIEKEVKSFAEQH